MGANKFRRCRVLVGSTVVGALIVLAVAVEATALMAAASSIDEGWGGQPCPELAWAVANNREGALASTASRLFAAGCEEPVALPEDRLDRALAAGVFDRTPGR